jgi:hypothetical protein
LKTKGTIIIHNFFPFKKNKILTICLKTKGTIIIYNYSRTIQTPLCNNKYNLVGVHNVIISLSLSLSLSLPFPQNNSIEEPFFKGPKGVFILNHERFKV